MHDRAFEQLECTLREAGIAPRHISRMIVELQDHLDDLRRDAVACGCNPAEAQASALRRLGDQRVLAQKVLERPELKAWDRRHPRIALIYYPVAYVLMLPMTPAIFRWGAALLLSATVTAAMMLAMQLSISLG